MRNGLRRTFCPQQWHFPGLGWGWEKLFLGSQPSRWGTGAGLGRADTSLRAHPASHGFLVCSPPHGPVKPKHLSPAFKGLNHTPLPCQLGAAGRRPNQHARVFSITRKAWYRCGPTERARLGEGNLPGSGNRCHPKNVPGQHFSNPVGEMERNAFKPKGALAMIFTRLPQQPS